MRASPSRRGRPRPSAHRASGAGARLPWPRRAMGARRRGEQEPRDVEVVLQRRPPTRRRHVGGPTGRDGRTSRGALPELLRKGDVLVVPVRVILVGEARAEAARLPRRGRARVLRSSLTCWTSSLVMGRALIEIKSRPVRRTARDPSDTGDESPRPTNSGPRSHRGVTPGFDPRRSRIFNLATSTRGGVVVCGAVGAPSGASLEERRECFRWPYGDDPGLVDPHALEELTDQLAALDRIEAQGMVTAAELDGAPRTVHDDKDGPADKIAYDQFAWFPWESRRRGALALPGSVARPSSGTSTSSTTIRARTSRSPTTTRSGWSCRCGSNCPRSSYPAPQVAWFSLVVLLEARGDVEGAEAAWRRGHEQGHAGATRNWGYCFSGMVM